MAGMKESAQARQRKEERRQAFYRSLTKRAQKERTCNKGAEAGTGVGPTKKARGDGVQEASISKPTTPATATRTACDPRGYASAVATASLPLAGFQEQQLSLLANRCSVTMDQSVFALQRQLLAQQQAQAAAAAVLPASNLYISSFLPQRQNMAAAAAAHLQQEERQRLLIAHRRELLKQRQRDRALTTAVARGGEAAARRFHPQQQEAAEQDVSSLSPSARANRARSAMALLVQQQRRIQDLEQQLEHAAASAGDNSASKVSKTAPVVVDLLDEDEGNEQGTMGGSSHSSHSSQVMQQHQVRQVVVDNKDGKQLDPVPPLSAYALFLKDEYHKVMRHAKANNRSVNPTVLLEAIATKWKVADQEVLVRYAVLASQDKERYQREYTVQAYLLQQQQHQHAQH